MIWSLSHRADPFAREIADRHYKSAFGAWTATAIGGGAILLAGVGMVVALQIGLDQKLDSRAALLSNLKHGQDALHQNLATLLERSTPMGTAGAGH